MEEEIISEEEHLKNIDRIFRILSRQINHSFDDENVPCVARLVFYADGLLAELRGAIYCKGEVSPQELHSLVSEIITDIKKTTQKEFLKLKEK